MVDKLRKNIRYYDSARGALDEKEIGTEHEIENMHQDCVAMAEEILGKMLTCKCIDEALVSGPPLRRENEKVRQPLSSNMCGHFVLSFKESEMSHHLGYGPEDPLTGGAARPPASATEATNPLGVGGSCKNLFGKRPAEADAAADRPLKVAKAKAKAAATAKAPPAATELRLRLDVLAGDEAEGVSLSEAIELLEQVVHQHSGAGSDEALRGARLLVVLQSHRKFPEGARTARLEEAVLGLKSNDAEAEQKALQVQDEVVSALADAVDIAVLGAAVESVAITANPKSADIKARPCRRAA